MDLLKTNSMKQRRCANKKRENLKKYYLAHRNKYKDYKEYKQKTSAYLLLKLADRNRERTEDGFYYFLYFTVFDKFPQEYYVKMLKKSLKEIFGDVPELDYWT